MRRVDELIEACLESKQVDEMSTSGGAGAYLTKYAFKLPKNYKQVKEGIVTKPKGAGSLPKYKADKITAGSLEVNDKGVKKPYYYKLGFKPVDREGLAKKSKAIDVVDLHNSTFK